MTRTFKSGALICCVDFYQSRRIRKMQIQWIMKSNCFGLFLCRILI